MRLWSLHPRYLDSKGLVALWREGLLAQNVLLGRTKGYKNHPQLNRFKAMEDPVSAISSYLWGVVDEADRRGYNFNRDKLVAPRQSLTLSVTQGQMDYEFEHLLNKLQIRDNELYEQVLQLTAIESHPLFTVVDGAIEEWEVIKIT